MFCLFGGDRVGVAERGREGGREVPVEAFEKGKGLDMCWFRVIDRGDCSRSLLRYWKMLDFKSKWQHVRYTLGRKKL